MQNDSWIPARRPWSWLLLLVIATLVLSWSLCSGRARLLLWQTSQLAVAAICIAVPMGTLLAWLMFRTKLAYRQFFAGVFLVTVAIPLYLQAAAWNAVFGQQGWWQLLMGGIGTEPLLRGFRGAAFVHGAAAIPWVVLVVGADLWCARRDQEEAALLETSQRQVAMRITLPHILVAALAAALWIAITVAGEITVTDLYQVRTYAEELYVGFAIDPIEDNSAMEPITMGALPGMSLLAGLMLCVFFVGWQVWPHRRTEIELSPPRLIHLGGWEWPARMMVVVVLFVLVQVPLLSLLYKCGATIELTSESRIRGWSLTKAASLLASAPWDFREELGWSLLLAQTSSLVALLIAVPTAWWSRSQGWRVALIAVLAALLVAVPGPLLALSVMWMFQAFDSSWLATLYSQSIAAPVIVMTAKALPIVLLIVWNGFARIGSTSTESARVAGAGCWKQLILIALPQQKPMLVCAWLVGVILALGDLAASILIVPPGVTTAAIRIFGLMHYGIEDQLAAICLVLVAIIAILAGLVGILWRWPTKMKVGPPTNLQQDR